MQTVKNYSGTVAEFWCHLVNPPMTGTGYVYRTSRSNDFYFDNGAANGIMVYFQMLD